MTISKIRQPQMLFLGCKAVILVTLSAMSLPSYGVGELENLSRELAVKRGEVERLQNDLELGRQQLKSEWQSLGQRRADLETSIHRDQLAIKALEERLSLRRQSQGSHQEWNNQLKAILQTSLTRLKDSVAASLPFKLKERQQAAIDLIDQLNLKESNSLTLLPQVWSLYEDEFRLRKESAMHRQVIDLPKDSTNEDQTKTNPVLVDVLRIGMIQLYFVTSDGRYGVADQGTKGYQYRMLADSQQIDAARQLFENMAKNIRSGPTVLANTFQNTGLPL